MTHWENRLADVEEEKKDKREKRGIRICLDLVPSNSVTVRALTRRRRTSAAEFCSQMAQAASYEIIPTLMEEQGRRLQNFHGLI